MLYDLIKTERGESTTVATGELSKMRHRLKQMRDSTRGKKVKYEVKPSDSTIKQPYERDKYGGRWKESEWPRRS